MKKNFSVSTPLSMSEVLGKMCKGMKKALTASEERGVHKPIKAPHLKGGMSRAGLEIGVSKNPAVQGHPVKDESIKAAKDQHSKVLTELKAMPKPKLTKADLEKFDQQLQKSWKPKPIEKATPAPAPMPKPAAPKQPKMASPKPPAPKPVPTLQMSDEKGVHGNIVHEEQASKKGISDAGRNVRNAREQNKRGQYNTAVSANETARRFHSGVLNELKAMPKPKLTKADIEAFDKKLESLKKK